MQKDFCFTLAIGLLACWLLGTADCAVTGWTKDGSAVMSATCISVAEGGMLAGTFQGTGGSGTVTYSIPTQPVTGLTFAIVSASGVLSLTGVLDHESNPTIDLVIRGADDGDSSNTDFTCKITVTDVPETAAVYYLTNAKFTLPNNVGPTTAIATITAVDAEGDTLAYAFASGTGTAFTYNSGTGALAVGATALTTNTYTLVLTAVDESFPPATSSTTVTVCVNTVCSSGAAAMTALVAFTGLAALLASLG